MDHQPNPFFATITSTTNPGSTTSSLNDEPLTPTPILNQRRNAFVPEASVSVYEPYYSSEEAHNQARRRSQNEQNEKSTSDGDFVGPDAEESDNLLETGNNGSSKVQFIAGSRSEENSLTPDTYINRSNMTDKRSSSAMVLRSSLAPGTLASNPSNTGFSQARTRREIINDPSVNVHAWKKRGNDAAESIISALYCKILVILGLAFPLSEVISKKVPKGFYQLFYIYLFLGSLLFLCYIYIDVMKTRTKAAVVKKSRRQSKVVELFQNITNIMHGTACTEKEESKEDNPEEEEENSVSIPNDNKMNEHEIMSAKFHESLDRLIPRPKQIYGSFYIRGGAVLFGMGSLIYSGIEIGMFFEADFGLNDHHICNKKVIILLRPFLQMIFVFIQMYFIFLNHKMNIYKNKLISRFGLMHMIATNLCVWFNVLILETYHEIEEIHSEKNHLEGYGFAENSSENPLKRETDHPSDSHSGHHHNTEVLTATCVHDSVMGDILASSGPFLFPCTIEYSLICAAVLFMMWKNTFEEHEHYKARRRRHKISFRMKIPIQMSQEELEREFARNQYSMDCSNANTGLFCGLFVMVFTIISLIVFFVLISSDDDNFQTAAIMVASLTEVILYSVTSVAVLIGTFQIRRLWYDSEKKLELDTLLLVVAQTGVLIYSSFCIIGAYFQLQEHITSFFASLMTLIQTVLQTIFILDASNRFAYCAEQVRNKPGRQVVTFLLICNLAMWAINTLETNRADSHPIQVKFYGGEWVWPIITHVSMPLAIFYRFHSTVCLCEIWTRSFKYKAYNYADL